ncbi:hypothetical protein GCM10011571_20140 [Marinithermofilum abyssi]|uniref:DUF5668 domain-containing protein n=1 Tax=Marinithermofilum abyssi TaxID=1571185 RepID=A0A8J2VHW7_9BACL|nr:hypothetical protein [Marinithermofilum abyssi]GGE18261.1 hypothetical protein GCM10011571_20140 [Marinithermofilum abyssi]
MRGKTAGLILVVAGIVLLMRELNWPYKQLWLNPEMMLIAAGFAVMLYAGKRSTHPRLLLWGGIVSGLGVHLWGLHYIHGWPEHWSVLPMILGAAFFMDGLFKRNRRNLWIGILMLLAGFFALPVLQRLPLLGSFSAEMNRVWPLFLILLGLLLTLKK